jgi:hypothetical protein
MEEDCIGSQGAQRTVVLEEEEKKKQLEDSNGIIQLKLLNTY